jgi:hypothetical protein
MQIVEAENAITNKHSLELNCLRFLIENTQSKIRYVFTSVRLTCKIEGIVDVLWEFASEKIFKGV